MYRLFDVRKFEMVKAALGEQLAAVKNMLLGFSVHRASWNRTCLSIRISWHLRMAKQNDLIKAYPVSLLVQLAIVIVVRNPLVDLSVLAAD